MKKLCALLLACSCMGMIMPQNVQMNYVIAASDKETYDQGYDDGYAYEMKHAYLNPDTYTSGSREYKEGYEDGVLDAYDELVDYAEKSAEENAKIDFENNEKNSSQCPDDVKFKSIYRDTYKKTYEELENDKVDDLEKLADENAKADVYNNLGKNSSNDEVSKKDRAKYTRLYNNAYSDYTAKLKAAKRQAAKEGKADAKEELRPNYQFISDFKGYEAYDELKKLYNDAYVKAGGILTNAATEGAEYRWKMENKKWYCYDLAGKKMKKQWIHSYDNWYYLSESGAMHTGWLASGNNWYYFDASGKMVTETIYLDGKVEKFNQQGHWMR